MSATNQIRDRRGDQQCSRCTDFDVSADKTNPRCILTVEEPPESRNFHYIEGTRKKLGSFFHNYFYADCPLPSFEEWAKALEKDGRGGISMGDFVQLVGAKK